MSSKIFPQITIIFGLLIILIGISIYVALRLAETNQERVPTRTQNELEILLDHSRMFLRENGMSKFSGRRFDQFIACCFLNVKFSTEYLKEIYNLVFYKGSESEKFNNVKKYFDISSSFVNDFLKMKNIESLKEIIYGDNFVSLIIASMTGPMYQYSDKFDVFAKKIVDKYPTNCNILEDKMEESDLSIVKLVIDRIVTTILILENNASD